MKFNKKIFFDINNIAVPLIISSISSIIMGIIDQAFIGRISIEAYAGVGLVLSCINSIIGVLGSISVAFNIVGAKTKGKGNIEEFNKIFTDAILLNLFIGVFLYIMILLFCKPIFHIVFGLYGQILEEAIQYIKIFGLSILLNLLIFIYSTVFKIFKKTKNILKITLIVNAINLFLDDSLVFGNFGFPKLGSVGAGIATIISLILNLFIYILISKKLVKLNFRQKNIFKKVIQLFKFSLCFIGQEFMEDIIFVFAINAIVARLGVLELSTYTLLSQVISVILMPMFGYSTANLSLVSEYYSKDKTHTCLSISKIICIILSAIFLILFTTVILLNDFIPNIITSDKTLIQFSTRYLYIAVFIQIFNYISTIYKSSIQSIGYEKWTLKVTFLINCISLFAILFIGRTLCIIYILIGLSYIISFVFFYFKYVKILKKSLLF